MVQALLRGAKPQGHEDRGYLVLEEMCVSDVDRLEPIIDELLRQKSSGEKKEARSAAANCEQLRRDRRRASINGKGRHAAGQTKAAI